MAKAYMSSTHGHRLGVQRRIALCALKGQHHNSMSVGAQPNGSLNCPPLQYATLYYSDYFKQNRLYNRIITIFVAQ